MNNSSMEKCVIYIRVSTQRQGASGLGLESQRKICNDFITSKGGENVAEFMDVESGTHRDRKGLRDAIAYCKKNHCALVIAKLDRLARDVEFCFKVINTGIEIHFVDMPQINTLLLGVFASVAQYERELTSDRTKKALAAKKARGEKTGGASDKWIEAYKSKTKEQHKDESMRRGQTKNERFIASREVQVFLKVLRNVFHEVCQDEDPTKWDWTRINTKGDNKHRILSLMQDYKSLDEGGTLFVKWDFDGWDITRAQMRLSAMIQNVRTSLLHAVSKGYQTKSEEGEDIY